MKISTVTLAVILCLGAVVAGSGAMAQESMTKAAHATEALPVNPGRDTG